MRKGLSLIELVFTIVIIAMVFTVIPKIVFALGKSDEFSIRQDALFNGMTLMQMITHLSWDENSTTSNDILVTQGDASFTCNDTTGYYRIGGFRGSRNCENNVSVRGTLGADGAENNTTFNDIDDFNGVDINTSIYSLHVSTRYIADTFTYTPLNQNARINLSSSVMPLSTNIKYVDINITYQGQKAALRGNTISQFSFASANIGKFFLNKRAW